MRLRKQEKLREAFQLAKKVMVDSAHSGDPDALLWGKRGMAWVLYDYLSLRVSKLESHVSHDEINKLLKVLSNVQKMDLPLDEDIFYEQFTWKVAQVFKSINSLNNENECANYVKRVFKAIESFDLSPYEEPYRVLLIQLHNALKNDSEYLKIIDWWGINNLKKNDFEENEGKHGKKFSSLAEQIYTSYAKHLIEANNQTGIDNDIIEIFLVKLDSVLERHEEYKFLRYRKAQLLLALEREQEAIQSFLPFVRNNKNQPWVWELLGDLHHKDQNMQLACYCKALTIKTKEGFINKLRLKLAILLINKSLWDEAKTEVDTYYDFRNNNGWKVSNQVNDWVRSPWYNKASARENNKKLYNEKANLVDKLLYGDLPETVIVVEYVNAGKSIINFIQKGRIQGFFKYSGFGVNPEVGDVLKVKIQAVGEDGYHNIFSIKKVKDDPDPGLLTEVNGKVDIKKGSRFGFINAQHSIFVDPGIIKKYKLSDGDSINGLAIINFDTKKKQWGWRLIRMNNN